MKLLCKTRSVSYGPTGTVPRHRGIRQARCQDRRSAAPVRALGPHGLIASALRDNARSKTTSLPLNRDSWLCSSTGPTANHFRPYSRGTDTRTLYGFRKARRAPSHRAGPVSCFFAVCSSSAGRGSSASGPNRACLPQASAERPFAFHSATRSCGHGGGRARCTSRTSPPQSPERCEAARCSTASRRNPGNRRISA